MVLGDITFIVYCAEYLGYLGTLRECKKEGTMIITVASYKGGVGKTTTAVHLAAYLQSLGPTLLLDGDQTRNA